MWKKFIKARVGTLFYFYKIFLLISICCYLSSCASSHVERDVTSNIDQGVEHTRDLFKGPGSMADSFQNSSQKTKGMIYGGAVGAIAGTFTSAVGAIPGAAAGVIIGGGYGAYIDSNTNLKDRLMNRGVTIVILGDQVLVVLPSARIFNALTADIKPDAYSTLTMVAEYLNRFTKISIKIAAYTNDVGSKRVALSLSQNQADSVARFLTASGLDARLLYAVGYGGENLVDSNTLDWDGSDNYRIEITLEKQYV